MRKGKTTETPQGAAWEWDWVPLEKVQRLPRNPKGHDLGAIHTSMKRGFLDTPTVNVRTGRLIGGHGRIDVLQQKKATGEAPPQGIRSENGSWLVPVWTVDVPEEEEEVVAIGLNRTTELGGWDEVQLAEVLSDLAAQGNLEGTGYDEEDLDRLIGDLAGMSGGGNGAEDPGPQIDKAAELQEKWGVQLGDLWEVGKHRIVCGDCTDRAVVERVMGGEKAGAVVTDPPYGCTELEWDRYPSNSDLNLWLQYSNGPVVAFGAALPRCIMTCLSLDPQPERIYIWWNTFTLTHSEGSFWQWQPIYVWNKNLFQGMDRDVIQMAANSGGDIKIHDTQKPSALLEILISGTTDNSVLDPFLGSGTTLVACERMGRLGRGIELEPKYVAVSLERLSGMGLQARRVDP